ncbi:CUE domain-containing protein [Fusarium sp. Ph1]|nr:CUE domain-containing protein [Fusarium sp. Ph1]
MSEVTSRTSASRGRGSGRGGRGGFAGRGGRRPNGDKADHKADDSLAAFEDEGDFGELRKQYGDKTSVIREMFPDWSEADVLFALQETNGDENEAVTRIAEGTISQWGEVSKPKKASRAKAKEQAPAPSNDATSTGPRAARGGRAVSEGRGRGRATDRGGRSTRGRSAHAAPTNGARTKENQQLSIPTEESSAWGSNEPKGDVPEEKEVLSEKPTPSANVEAPKPAAPPVKTWASMLRQSTVPKAPPKPKEAPAPKPAPEPVEPESVPEPVEPEPEPEVAPEPEPAPAPAVAEPDETTPVADTIPPSDVPHVVEPEVALPPSKDELTETNLEQVVDDSKPPPTGTAASTAADSWDPRQNPASVTATPLSAAQQQHIPPRPDASGFAATAAKATAERTTRTPSHHHHHQRRVLDQEEAVRMPGNREVDRAAVQFGAFNLADADEDIDGDREEPETRAQPPADSPVAHPRTSLPPATQAAVPEAFAQKPASTVTPIAAPTAPASQTQAPAQAQVPGQAPASNAQQFGRFGQAGAQEAAAAPQKPLDPFNQQSTPSSQPPFDNFPTQTSQPQQPGGAFSSAPSDYGSYYTANQPDRNATYAYYNQQFGQQGQGQQDATASQQRPFAGYGASQADNLSQYPQSGALHNQPRFGGSAADAQNSGNSTPNPTTQAQQQQQPQQPAQQQPAQGSQPQSHGQQYPGYNHPYYNSPYYHQYYSGYGQGGFGPYGKSGMYGQPYGMSPNAPYDHTSSPAGFGQSSLHRDSGLGSGLGDYGRVATSQAGSQPGLGGSAFGSVHDSFGRSASSFQSQGQSFNSQTQPGNAGSTDELKPFGETKTAAGPSPSLGGARPGSATNAPAAQAGLPPPQNSQMGGYGAGYPSHLQGHGLHGSNAYGMGGNAGASQQHGNSPYGSYGQGFGSGYYGGGQQQQQQQQQRGWGGNYH